MRFNFTLFTAIFFVSTLSKAQDFKEGFIVTQQYDTIEGLVKKQGDRSSEKVCVFKNTISGNEVIYSPQKILSYGYNGGRVYVSNELGIEINRLEPSFIRLIVDGDVPLYYFKGQYAYRAPSKRLYLLLKQDDFYKSNLGAVLVNECFDLTNRIESLQLTDKSLADFFLSYYNCLNKPAKVYLGAKEPNSLDLAFGPTLGSLNASSSGGAFEEFSSSPPATAGLNLKVRFIKGSRSKLNFTTSVSLLYHKSFLIDYTDENYAYETSFDYQSIRIAIGGSYLLTTLSDNLRLNLLLEAGSGLASIGNQKRIIDEFVGSDIYVRTETFEIEKFEPFASIGLVTSYSAGSKVYFIEINDSMAFGNLKSVEATTSYTLNSVSILLGLKLPLR